MDDMISLGMVFVCKTLAKNKWNPNKGASLATYIKGHLFYFYANQVIDRYQDSKGYSDTKLIYISDLGQFETKMLVKPKGLVYECGIAETLLKVHQAAPLPLQEQMQRWFLELTDRDRIYTKGKKFRHHCDEFRKLAEQYQLTYDDCRHLIASPRCMDVYSRFVKHIPYNLDDPLPATIAPAGIALC